MIPADLSKRERQVYTLAVQGRSNLSIATDLFISEKTVKYHLTSVYKKTLTASRHELIARHWAALTLGPTPCN